MGGSTFRSSDRSSTPRNSSSSTSGARITAPITNSTTVAPSRCELRSVRSCWFLACGSSCRIGNRARLRTTSRVAPTTRALASRSRMRNPKSSPSDFWPLSRLT